MKDGEPTVEASEGELGGWLAHGLAEQQAGESSAWGAPQLCPESATGPLHVTWGGESVASKARPIPGDCRKWQ